MAAFEVVFMVSDRVNKASGPVSSANNVALCGCVGSPFEKPIRLFRSPADGAAQSGRPSFNVWPFMRPETPLPGCSVKPVIGNLVSGSPLAIACESGCVEWRDNVAAKARMSSFGMFSRRICILVNVGFPVVMVPVLSSANSLI